MATLDELKKVGTSKSGVPRDKTQWVIYKTEAHGYAVRDYAHFEWRAVLLKDGEKELHDKDEAIKFLNDNGIEWKEYVEEYY